MLAIFLVVIYSLTVFVAAQFLFYKAAKKVKSIHLGLILLLEPVIGTSLDVIFLDTPMTWNIAAGGALILFANVRLIIKSS